MVMRLLVLCLVAGACLVCGCGGDETMTTAEKVKLFRETSRWMDDNDMSGSVTLDLTGRGEVYQKCGLGIDTGVRVRASAIFNAQAGTAANTNGIP